MISISTTVRHYLDVAADPHESMMNWHDLICPSCDFPLDDMVKLYPSPNDLFVCPRCDTHWHIEIVRDNERRRLIVKNVIHTVLTA